MSSKALYLSKVAPRLVHRQVIGSPASAASSTTAIEVWTTTCLVLNFGSLARSSTSNDAATNNNCTVLINPANPQLTGVAKFPYFPRGGPVPPAAPRQYEHHIMGHVSQWGGMQVGNGMLFPASVLDGLVHTYGGWQLQAALSWHRIKAAATAAATTSDAESAAACPVGQAVRTTAGNDRLGQAYGAVIHAVPPFYAHPPSPERDDDLPAKLLHRCYMSALNQLREQDRRVATPLLGAGCRGFPLQEAMSIAVDATTQWCRENSNRHVTIAFGLLEEAWAQQMVAMVTTTKSGQK